jgi:hypothetical protein
MPLLNPTTPRGEGGYVFSPFVCLSRYWLAVRGETTDLIVRPVGEIICKGTGAVVHETVFLL